MKKKLIFVLLTILTLCSCSEKKQKEAEIFNYEEIISTKTISEETAYERNNCNQSISNNKYNYLTRNYNGKLFLLGPIKEELGIYCYDETNHTWVLCTSADAVLGPIYENGLYYIFLPRNGNGNNIEIRRLNLDTYENETIYEYNADSDVTYNTVMIYDNKMFLNHNGQLETGIYAELDDNGKLKKKFSSFQKFLGDEYKEGKYMLSADYMHMFFLSETDKEVFAINSFGQFSKLNINDTNKVILITNKYIILQNIKGNYVVFDFEENDSICTWNLSKDVTLITYDSDIFYGGIEMDNQCSIVSIDKTGNIKNLFTLENISYMDQLGLSVSDNKVYFYDIYSNNIISVDLQAGECMTVK